MRAVMCGVVLVVAACGPPNPCSGHQFDRLRRYSLPTLVTGSSPGETR